MMLNGQYSYLAYMLLSTTCFFFYMTPNCHKLRSMFYGKNKMPFIPSGTSIKNHNATSPMLTRRLRMKQ